ncbi:hypothetical protein HDU91_001262, partial [Kappamyces sp. JEL0680]
QFRLLQPEIVQTYPIPPEYAPNTSSASSRFGSSLFGWVAKALLSIVRADGEF